MIDGAPALNISPDFTLPREAVTETFGVLAKRGVGKTYTILVLVEEMLKVGLPVVVVDPIGVAWGLRASADGKGPGLPIAILGGDHGDVPIDPTSGRLVADLIVDERCSAILDLSLFRKGESVRFMTDFAETLYRRNREPLHLVLDEADAFAPQRPQKGEERLLGAIEDLVRRGRARGIGISLVTQRAAVLNKNVLTQIEVLVALRTIAPQDRDAIDAWVQVHGTPEQRHELMASLPSLPIGTAWFWSPGWLNVFTRVQVRRRETFDSSSTPKLGQTLAAPKTLADVDLAGLRERLAATIERTKAEDPAELRRQVAELKRQLAGAAKAPPTVKVETVVERVEVPAISAEVLARLAVLVGELREVDSAIVEAVGRVDAARRVDVTPKPPPAEQKPRVVTAPVGVVGVSPYARGLIETIGRRHPMRLTRAQISTLSGRRPRSSAFQAAMAEIVRSGLAVQEGDQFALTPAGLALAGSDAGTPRSAEEVQEMWREALPSYERNLLDALIEAYPSALNRQELSTRTGRSLTSSAFQGAISSLVKNGLAAIDDGGIRAKEVLF